MRTTEQGHADRRCTGPGMVAGRRSLHMVPADVRASPAKSLAFRPTRVGLIFPSASVPEFPQFVERRTVLASACTRSPSGVRVPTPEWSILMNSIIRNSVLGIAGLAFAGGVAAGPLTDTHTPTVDTTPVAAVAVQADKPAVDTGKLIPHGVQGAQSRIDLSDEQVANTKAIIAATKKAGMDERAAVVSIATALQESKLENLGHLGDRNDHDSQGLFQQRPSSGWGTVEQITDPEYSTTAFLKGLKQVDGWQDMPLTKAAQTVQVSAYPDHYAQWEQLAADLVAKHWNS
ncbi:hypothetical protein GA0070608_0218 [Micromonospora peucetia]|uniref:Uncharacterized protein n=2 Tax=Micromonospora peucetia TaxID=47871 RepID=A0A1C6U0K5_9ACTN|nr:hypothetical protein GA0070608_0218 [Micromonospora peucetia]